MNTMEIHFSVNGKACSMTVPTSMTLLELLRDELGLTGAKHGCGIGECGACTVIMDHKAVNACLILAPQINGSAIQTVEGLRAGNQLHDLQQAFVDNHAVQCGFCSSGMLMSAKALLDANPDPSEKEIRTALAGNLCRCTGYSAIVYAVKDAAKPTE